MNTKSKQTPQSTIEPLIPERTMVDSPKTEEVTNAMITN